MKLYTAVPFDEALEYPANSFLSPALPALAGKDLHL